MREQFRPSALRAAVGRCATPGGSAPARRPTPTTVTFLNSTDSDISIRWTHEDTIQQPATEFGVARKFAYQRSQAGRDALPETAYECVFETGNIDTELGEMLNARRVKKQREGHVDSAPK